MNNFIINVVSTIDYYPFGMQMPGRGFTATSSQPYRFGFNGKEKVDEIDGVSGSKLDFGARIYDSRVGKWFSTEPLFKKYPNLSPYNYCNNNPIHFVDKD